MCPYIFCSEYIINLSFLFHFYFLAISSFLVHPIHTIQNHDHTQHRCRYRIGVRLADHRLRSQPVAETAAVFVRYSGLRPVRGHGSVLFDDGFPAAVRLLRSVNGQNNKQHHHHPPTILSTPPPQHQSTSWCGHQKHNTLPPPRQSRSNIIGERWLASPLRRDRSCNALMRCKGRQQITTTTTTMRRCNNNHHRQYDHNNIKNISATTSASIHLSLISRKSPTTKTTRTPDGRSSRHRTEFCKARLAFNI